MKTIISTLFLVCTLVLTVSAQNQDASRKIKVRDQIAETKLNEMRQSLNLDQATYEKFKPIYLKYEQEIMSINADSRKVGRLTKVNADSLSDEEANQVIAAHFDNLKKMVAVREKYTTEFSTALKPQQIIKLYQTENEIRKKVMAEIKKRKLDKGGK